MFQLVPALIAIQSDAATEKDAQFLFDKVKENCQEDISMAGQPVFPWLYACI